MIKTRSDMVKFYMKNVRTVFSSRYICCAQIAFLIILFSKKNCCYHGMELQPNKLIKENDGKKNE